MLVEFLRKFRIQREKKNNQITLPNHLCYTFSKNDVVESLIKHFNCDPEFKELILGDEFIYLFRKNK